MTYTYLRHSARHVQQTIIDRVRASLVSAGWLDHAPGAGPFGTDDITFLARRLKESEYADENAGNMVAVSFTGEPDLEPDEMGGGLVTLSYVVFCDVIGKDDSLSLAIANDIKDDLSGLKPGTIRWEPVYDYTAQPRTPVLGWSMEFTQVARSRPEGDDYRRLWNLVGATAEVSFVGND